MSEIFPERVQATAPGRAAAPAPGQAAEPEVPVHLVQLWLCDPCLNGAGGECHTPGCALWINRAPDLPLHKSPFATVIADPASDPHARIAELETQLAEAVNPAAQDCDHAAEILRLRGERDQLRERLAAASERLAQLAGYFEESAKASHPSKKSETERHAAKAVREAAAGLED